MKINSFNSKVNLPKFCKKLGYKDYSFVRVPTFGWYAYNKDLSVISNVFDLVDPAEREQIYAVVAKGDADYLDFDLAYSDLGASKLNYSLLEAQLWTSAYSLAKKSLATHRITFGGRKLLLRDVLVEQGLGGLIENGVGVISSEVRNEFNMLPWPSGELRGHLLLPSFCTPQHICSLEHFRWDEPNKLFPLWLNDEKGWYGNIKAKNIVSEIKDLCTTPGITWDYKADYWFQEQLVDLSDTLSVSDSLRIWAEAKNTVFRKSPLNRIIESGQLDELKQQIGQLNYTQLQEIETATGQKLIEYWKRAREVQIQIGERTFLKRDNRYYVYKKGTLCEVTNFAIEIDKITRKGKKFVRSGYLYFGNQAVPFEMDEDCFATNRSFQKGIADKFLKAGLGIPIIHPDFATRSLLIVNSFNAGVTVDLSPKKSNK